MLLSVHLERINTARLFHWSLGWKWRENKDKPAWHPQQVATVWAEVESGRRHLLFYLLVHYIWWLASLPGKINELIVIMRFCLVSPLSRCETFFAKIAQQEAVEFLALFFPITWSTSLCVCGNWRVSAAVSNRCVKFSLKSVDLTIKPSCLFLSGFIMKMSEGHVDVYCWGC